MQYSRREILDLVLDFVGENGDANARNTAERLLDLAIWNIWVKMPWQQFMMSAPYQFDTVAGLASYPMPSYFGRVAHSKGLIRNLTTGARLFPTTLEQLQEHNPAAGTTLDTPGAPQMYMIGGTVFTDRQVNPIGEVVFAKSDDAADTNVKVTVMGIDPRGNQLKYEITLNGVAEVQIGVFTKVLEVTKAYIAGIAPAIEGTSSRGTVTVLSYDSGALPLGELVRIHAGEAAVERPELTLWPTPNSVQTIAVPVMRSPMRLYYDSDATPRGWGSAILEEMNTLWQINSGERPDRPAYAGPALQDLIALENGNRFGAPSRTRPFTG